MNITWMRVGPAQAWFPMAITRR